MAYYVILSTLTYEGRKTIKENPKRILEVNKELEKMGIKVKEQFAVLGPYDFVNIVEATDNNAIMKMSVDIGSRGSVQLLTLAAMPIADFIKKIKYSLFIKSVVVIIRLDRIIQGFPCKRESSSLMVPRFSGDKLDCPIKLGNDRNKKT
jgi:uncharacterized protein with GYD domain